MARYRSCPAVSQIWALMVLSSILTERVANSTPIVDLLSGLNSSRVKRDNRLDFPTPESPINTTRGGEDVNTSTFEKMIIFVVLGHFEEKNQQSCKKNHHDFINLVVTTNTAGVNKLSFKEGNANSRNAEASDGKTSHLWWMHLDIMQFIDVCA